MIIARGGFQVERKRQVQMPRARSSSEGFSEEQGRQSASEAGGEKRKSTARGGQRNDI